MAKAKSVTIYFGDETGKRSVTVEPKEDQTVAELVELLTNGQVTPRSHTLASSGKVVGKEPASSLEDGQTVAATATKTEGGS